MYDMKITKAAIKTGDGEVYAMEQPNRHGDVLRFVGGLGCTDYGKWEQGFIAEINGEEKFVGRAQAWHIAGDAGQLKDVNRKGAVLLFSEDLW